MYIRADTVDQEKNVKHEELAEALTAAIQEPSKVNVKLKVSNHFHSQLIVF